MKKPTIKDIIVLNRGPTVRLLHGTPSQRRELWVVDDITFGHIKIHRSSDEDSIIIPNSHVEPCDSVLDLMAAQLDDE